MARRSTLDTASRKVTVDGRHTSQPGRNQRSSYAASNGNQHEISAKSACKGAGQSTRLESARLAKSNASRIPLFVPCVGRHAQHSKSKSVFVQSHPWARDGLCRRRETAGPSDALHDTVVVVRPGHHRNQLPPARPGKQTRAIVSPALPKPELLQLSCSTE
jgi:hypothetical protein